MGHLDPRGAAPKALADSARCCAAGLAAWTSGDAAMAAAWSSFAECASAARPTDRCHAADGAAIAVLRAAVEPRHVASALEAVDVARPQLPAGGVHAAASAIRGTLQLALGHPERAVESWRDGAAEASIVGSAPVEALCRSWCAAIAFLLGRTAVGRSQLAAVRRLETAQRLDGHAIPLAVAVVADGLDAAISGDERRSAERVAACRVVDGLAEADWFHRLHLRIVLAHASVAAGDHVGARHLIAVSEQLAASAPEARWARTQLAELSRRLDVARAELPPGPLRLTAAERRVLERMTSQLTLAEIATLLGVSTNTVKTHATALYRKLGVGSRRDAVTRAVRCGLLSNPGAEVVVPLAPVGSMTACTCTCHASLGSGPSTVP